MGIFGVVPSKRNQETEPKTHFIGKKIDTQRFKSSSGVIIVDVIEPASSTADNSSEEEGYYRHEEEVLPLTIKATTGQGSLTDSSEGTEITMAAARKLDKYGFIVNIDANGMVYESPLGPANAEVPTFADAKRTARRERKWNTTLNAWEKRRSKKLKERLRKGIPDSLRGRVWLLLGGGIRKPGLYQEIVQKTSGAMMDNYKELAIHSATPRDSEANSQGGTAETATSPLTSSDSESSPQRKGSADVIRPTGSNSSARSKNGSKRISASSPTSREPPADQDYAYSKAFRTVQDTIERDIHRTFPRHSLFYEEDNMRDDDAVASAASSLLGLAGMCDPELASLILNLERDIKTISTSGATMTPLSTSATVSSKNKLSIPDGQAALRRVLRAYSYYDREISYCQGMNFIAGMFLTVMSEEEAFWLLVAVMYEKPCEMRGMFGEGMRETHKVLHVAERLIHMHLPKLARHFDRENIHVTMYATQWLLTQYTSSFKFDLVTRVWDAFLGEGWKVIYRVMLALLQQWQSQLLKMSFEEILAFFRELPDRVNGNAVMETALRIKLKTRQIVKLEKEWYDKQQQ